MDASQVQYVRELVNWCATVIFGNRIAHFKSHYGI